MSNEKMSIAQAMGITRTVIRPREESDIQIREDRIGKYFKKYLNKFVFVEFSDEFLAKTKGGEIMRGVPVPLRKKEIKDFAGGDGISMLVLGENMAWVMGCDPHFKYTKNYTEFLRGLYNRKLEEGMLKEGRDAAERGDMDNACIHFRAALCIRYDYLHAMYSYARACRAMYLNSRNEEYVGRFKAESLEWFELLTETHPRFAQGYYYLGYAYLNIGLYSKAQISWNSFLKFSKNNKDKKEIRKRIAQIEEPLQIEKGYNEVLAGRYETGIAILEPFLSSKFNDWWPLHYYLGIAYEMTGKRAEAVSSLKKVLQLNASHIETMKELLKIYEDEGSKENIKKYSKKIRIVEEAMKEEQAMHIKEIQEEDKKLEEEEPELAEPEHIELEEESDASSDKNHDSKDVKASKSNTEKKSLVKRLGKK